MDEKKKDMGDEVSTVNTSQSSPEKEENHNHCCGCGCGCGCCLKENSVNVDGSSSSSLESNQPGCYQCVPIGWKFKPSDLDIVSYYLPRKVSNQPMQYNTIKEVTLYDKVPFEIMEEYKDEEVDGEWYFFTKRERKYAKGGRPRRDIGDGLGKWKINGDAAIFDEANKRLIGVRRTLEYYRGSGNPKASNMTNIRMDEYILETGTEERDEELANDDPSRAQKRKKEVFHEWALCRIRKVANPKPKPAIK